LGSGSGAESTTSNFGLLTLLLFFSCSFKCFSKSSSKLGARRRFVLSSASEALPFFDLRFRFFFSFFFDLRLFFSVSAETDG